VVSNTEYTEISSGVLGDYIFLTIVHGLGGGLQKWQVIWQISVSKISCVQWHRWCLASNF